MHAIQRPALHFIALGVLLFAADRLLLAPGAELRADPGATALVFSPARIEALHRDWLSRFGVAPGPAEIRALIAAEVDDELLYREARRRGFHHSDDLVRRRLARNMGFARDGAPLATDDLVLEAFELGMDRTDLVVRRRLIQKMKLRAYQHARAAPPTERELEAYRARNAGRFTAPARTRLAHVFFSRDRRGASLEDDARAALDELVARAAGPDRASEIGDPFLHGGDLPSLSERELAARFGAEFASRVVRLEPGMWSGPIASSYGDHLVWVRERTPTRAFTLDPVRGEVREALLRERGDAELNALLGELRRRYPIQIEGAPLLAAFAVVPG